MSYKVGSSAMFQGEEVTIVDRPSRSERIVILPSGLRYVAKIFELSPVPEVNRLQSEIVELRKRIAELEAAAKEGVA
jgi:hypothetical protein